MMIPHYEHNDSNNFIAGGYIDEKVCDNLISYFEKCKYKENGKVGSSPSLSQEEKSLPLIDDKILHSVKKSTDLGIQHINKDKEPTDYLKQLDKVLELYKLKYKYCDEGQGRWNLVENWNIQRYIPGEGFYKFHTERIGIDSRDRHLVFMTYLNDVTDGGETEFYHQELKIKPKKGLTIVWPAGFTHVHRGITSNTETKYIATGWYGYY